MKTSPLEELFCVTYGNKFDLNKMILLPRAEGGVSFVSRSSENHGVSANVKIVDRMQPFAAGLITVSLGGTKLLSSFVQEHPFYTAQNVAVLTPKISLSFPQKIFVCLAIRHNRFRYSAFGREANRTIKKLEIPALNEFPIWLNAASVKATSPLLSQLLPLKSEPRQDASKRSNVIGANMVVVSELLATMHLTNREPGLSDSSASDADVAGAGAPAREMITSEMIDKVTSIIIRADYRFEDERDVAKQILHSYI